ncbi:hypothetical protein CEE69_22120 [Rhodopirellula bahusiensis]|uniref:Erythromycin biosynthesis protein CIII-like C-terminal domain-containing protein n=1 Tax=Rhodopirellula bahusiensis TaxID=2014065 RepID=A0A2G1W2R8_9BACT|nr:hypothetical protein CEE69_22120 [Rhodopirellula bahusiensis]
MEGRGLTKVLITWELGGGLGHLTPIRTLAGKLLDRGHEVCLAVRDLVSAGSLFEGLPVSYYQSPHRIEPFRPEIDPPVTYEHMLHNIGFGTEPGLNALSSAWVQIFEHCKPDAVLFEHSPVAMFAARAYGFRKAVTGTGFTVPPTPLPLIRPWMRSDESGLQAGRRRTLSMVNAVAGRFGNPPLGDLSEIYGDADVFLRTYPELDHFGRRQAACYVGIDVDDNGKKPQWPYGDGPKIFAYLKPFQGFQDAILQIHRLKLPTIVFCPGLRKEDVVNLETAYPSMLFSTELLCMNHVAVHCDVAVCHGGHGMVARMLIAGVPVVAIPLQLEQTLLSQRLAESGAGIQLAIKDVSQLGEAINHILANEKYYQNAGRMSEAYFDEAKQGSWQRIAEWIDES